MKKNMCMVLVVVVICAISAYSQDLMYEQGEVQVSYDGNPSVPVIIFNGKDLTAIYHWSGVGDEGIGLYTRRVGLDGQPIGPQKQVMPLEIFDPLTTAVWDGEAYTVYLAPFQSKAIYIVRFDASGKKLASKTVNIDNNKYMFRRMFPFVVGERTYFFFSIKESPGVGSGLGGQAYLISHDRALKETPTLSEMPKAGFDTTVTNGVALGPDYFLVMACHYSGENEINDAALLHLGFDGELKKTIKPAMFNRSGSHAAEQIETNDLADVVGPLFMGDSYLMVGTETLSFFSPANSYPFKNTSLKIDANGQILDGPYDLGNAGGTLYLGTPKLLGQYVGIAINDLVAFDSQLSLLGEKGKHITDVSLHEEQYALFFPVSTSFDYSGESCVTLNLGRKDRYVITSGRGLFANIMSDPAFVKPGVVYFLASSAAAFGDTRRLVMWSVSSGKKVSLKGKGVNLKNLPAVFHTVIDTKGNTTKLRLRYQGTDGKNRKSKLVINP